MKWLTLLLVGCSGSDDGSVQDDDDDTSPTDAVPTADTSLPVSDWDIAPTIAAPEDPKVGLAAVLTLVADRPCTLEITLDSGTHRRVISPPDLVGDHEVPILGMRADQTYEVTVVATDADGLHGVAVLEWTTAPIPARFPKFDVVTLDKSRAEPGWLLFDADTFNGTDFLVIMDEDLEVVWYLETDVHWDDVGITPEGTLVGITYPAVREIDLLGRPIRTLTPFPGGDPADIVIPYGFHHDCGPREGGGLVGLVSRPLPVASYPTDYDLSGFAPTDIMDHGLAQVSADGTVESVVWLAPLLDTKRIGYDSLSELQGLKDWAHANGVAPTDDGGWVVSLRHQDAVVKIDAAGELVWILSRIDGWSPPLRSKVLTPIGSPIDPTYHQHSPAFDADGNLLLMDNGNNHRLPYDGPTVPFVDYSRIVAYHIDETAMTVEQVWEYRDTPSGELFADATGDADPQPITGNVLGVFGRVRTIDSTDLEDLGLGSKAGVILEFDPANPDPPALHMTVSSQLTDNPDGWAVYRADKLKGLYPWEQ